MIMENNQGHQDSYLELARKLKIYDAGSRWKEIQTSWSTSWPSVLKEVEELVSEHCKSKNKQPSSKEEEKHRSSGTGADIDLDIQLFQALTLQIQEFAAESQQFRGPCFTKFYRQLNSTLLNIQQSLDKIEAKGDPAVKQRKDEIHSKASSIWTDVQSRTHSSGFCPDCEVKQT